jgi:hypothetical protein
MLVVCTITSAPPTTPAPSWNDDRLSPISDTSTKLEWVQQFDDCGALPV